MDEIKLTDEQAAAIEFEFAKKHGLVDAKGVPFDPTVCWIDRERNLRRDHIFSWLWEEVDNQWRWSNVARCACGYQRVLSRSDLDAYKRRDKSVPWPVDKWVRPVADALADGDQT